MSKHTEKLTVLLTSQHRAALQAEAERQQIKLGTLLRILITRSFRDAGCTEAKP